MGSIAGDVIEALGHLLAELGDLAGQCLILAGACRAQLASRKAAEAEGTHARGSPPLPRRA